MSINSKSPLFQAILAMDSYNRGYAEGVRIVDGADVEGSSLGSALIFRQSAYEEGSYGVLKGFYAIAYQYKYMEGSEEKTETVISYRGTDQFFTSNGIGGDIINSYGIGAGTLNTPQTGLAIQFYKDVAATLNAGNPDPYLANISVTGHSAGGGLAGLVGAIYGKEGVLFDNMAFQNAANDNAVRRCVVAAG